MIFVVLLGYKNLNKRDVSLLLYIRNVQTINSPHYTYLYKIVMGIKKDRQLYLYKQIRDLSVHCLELWNLCISACLIHQRSLNEPYLNICLSISNACGRVFVRFHSKTSVQFTIKLFSLFYTCVRKL